jgi:hypothetical protein
MRDADPLGDISRIVDVLPGATGSLAMGGRPMIVKLQRDADDVVALRLDLEGRPPDMATTTLVSCGRPSRSRLLSMVPVIDAITSTRCFAIRKPSCGQGALERFRQKRTRFAGSG